jgi:hypothetical protein
MIKLEMMKSYKAKAKGHPDKQDGTESIGDFVPMYEYPMYYEARRYSSQVYSGVVLVNKEDGRIIGKDGPTFWFIQDDTPVLPKGYEKECDCGGYKTYSSWSTECHSSWCKVNT